MLLVSKWMKNPTSELFRNYQWDLNKRLTNCEKWTGNSIFSQKKLKKRQKWWTTFRIYWLWRALDADEMTPGQLLGYPCKLGGITVQSSYVEGRWHQNWAYTSPKLFLQTDKEISEKNRNFFTLRPVTRKRREILGWAIKGQMIYMHRGPTTFLAKSGCGTLF